MSPLRRTALVAGVLYLLTFVSIPTLALYGPVRDPNYIVGPGPDTPVIFGGVRFFKPGAYLRTHAEHMQRWHGESRGAEA
jgi:hypothetical protein